MQFISYQVVQLAYQFFTLYYAAVTGSYGNRIDRTINALNSGGATINVIVYIRVIKA